MAQQQNKQNEQKKSTPGRRSSFTLGSLVNVLAFCALAAAAILLVIGPILKWILNTTNAGAVVMQALNLVSQYCLLAAIAIPGWFFVRGKRKGWKIAYFVFLVIYIAGTILGMTLGI